MPEKRDLQLTLDVFKNIYSAGFAEEIAEYAIQFLPLIIDRAIAAEKRAEELENQVDVLSTTANSYVPSYYELHDLLKRIALFAKDQGFISSADPRVEAIKMFLGDDSP